MEDRSCKVIRLFVVTRPRARVVPWAIAQTDRAHVDTSPHVRPDIVDERIIEQGGVRVEDALLEAVHDDTRCGRDDLDRRKDPRTLLHGDENFADLGMVRVLAKSDLPKEVAAGVGDADQKKCKRCTDGGIDSVLNGCEYGDEHSSRPDEEFQRGHPPECIHLAGTGHQVRDGVDDDGGEASVGNVEEGGSQAVQGHDDDDRS